jgi:hypothetical protein
MSTENSLKPSNGDQEKFADLIKLRFVDPVEGLVTGGKRHWELEKSIDAEFDYDDVEYVLDATVNTPEEIAEEASFGYHDTPTHEVTYTVEDEEGQSAKGKTFRLIGSTLYVVPFNTDQKDWERDRYYREGRLTGDISKQELDAQKRMREARTAADALATYEAKEPDLVELAVVLDKFKGRKPTHTTTF